jgi:hypothetical protein
LSFFYFLVRARSVVALLCLSFYKEKLCPKRMISATLF